MYSYYYFDANWSYCFFFSLTGSFIIDQNLLMTIHLPMLGSLKLNMDTVAIKTVNQFLLGCPKLETLEGCFPYGDYSKLQFHKHWKH
jgi:hypothetical protein